MHNRFRLLGCLTLVWVLAGCEPPQAGQPPKPDKEKVEKPAAAKEAPLKTPTHKVAKGPFRVEVALKGIFEAEETKEVALSLKAWTPGGLAAPLTVLKAVPHGTAVKKGDVLVELDLAKIDQAIQDLEADRALSAAAIRQAEEELPVLEKSLPLDLAEAERSKKLADEDLKKFLEVDRPLAQETAEQSVKNTTFYLESAKEELRQLQKMYRSKDLTEETEEFILKRQRHQVEAAEFSLKTARIRHDQTLKVDLPRQEETFREKAAKQELGLQKAKNTLPLTVNQKRLALQKMKYESQKSAERLKNLETDRDAMTIRAPADGIVYYGRSVHGQWPTASAAATRLHRGGALAPDEVFMTIVSARPISVRAVVEEKDLHLVRPDLQGKVLVAGYPDLKLPARLSWVSAVPQTPGNFDARVTVELGKAAEAIMPGMACTAKFGVYHKDDVLAVPAGAVFTDEADEDAHYVYLVARKGKPEKRPVKVGKTAGSKTEILEGLHEGEEILTAKPNGK